MVNRSPYYLALVTTVGVACLQLRLINGDLFNSYPFLFSDSYDWIMHGRYMLDLVSGVELPRLQVLRDPGFVLFATLDQLAGGAGYVIVWTQAAATFFAACFLVRSVRLFTDQRWAPLFAAVIFLYHPGLALLRFYVMADQLAISLMAASFFFMLRWHQHGEDRAYLLSAVCAGAGMLTQKYAVLPFLVGSGISVLQRGKGRRRFFKLVALGSLIALGPELSFLFGFSRAIPHQDVPTQLGLLGFSFANVGFYAHTWSYNLLCLLPMGLFALWHAPAWMRNPALQCAIAVAIAFNVLAFFAQWQDARYSSYGYVSVLTSVVAAFSVAAASGAAPWQRFAARVAIVTSLGVFLLQTAGTPHWVLGPKRQEIFSSTRAAWPLLLARARPVDRFGVNAACPEEQGHLCPAAQAAGGASPYERYTWRYYYCLETGRVDECQPPYAESSGVGSAVAPELLPNRPYIQRVVASRGNLMGVSITLATYARRNGCSMTLTVSDGISRDVVYRQRLACADIINNAPRGFFFPPIADSAGRPYVVRLESSDSAPGNAITAYLAGGSVTGARLIVGDKPEDKRNLAFELFYRP